MNELNMTDLKQQCVAEFFGTGLFLFFGISCLCAVTFAGASFGLWEICITWGLGIALAVYLTAGVSGAHLNPAVTIALWIFAGFDRRKVAPYIGAQVLGAFSGAALAYFFYSDLFTSYELAHGFVRGSVESLSYAGVFSTYPHPDITVFHAFAVEVVITGILMCLILALTDDGNGVPRGPLAPLLIGVLVAIIGATTAPLTGFAMNPARDLGPKLFAFLAGWGDIAFTGGRSIPYFLIPVIAPVIGSCLGGYLYTSVFGASWSKKVEQASDVLNAN